MSRHYKCELLSLPIKTGTVLAENQENRPQSSKLLYMEILFNNGNGCTATRLHID